MDGLEKEGRVIPEDRNKMQLLQREGRASGINRRDRRTRHRMTPRGRVLPCVYQDPVITPWETG